MSTDHLQENQRMRPGVKALIIHEDKILMINEHVLREGDSIDITDFPGGGLEFGEDLITALKREVKEEVGLEIFVEKVVGAWDFVLGPMEINVEEKKGVHIVCIGYQCRLIGEPVIDMSHNPAQEYIFDAKWYTKDELLNGDLLRKSSGMYDAVKNLDL